MRVLRGGFAFLLTSILAGSLMAQTANATIDATDPDDVSSSFDISQAESHLAGEAVVFKIHFYDDLDWTHHNLVNLYLDSRKGPAWDYYVGCWRPRGRIIRCGIVRRFGAGNPTRPEFNKVVLPRRITLSFRRSFLRPTRAIRWRVLTESPDPDHHGSSLRDQAPDGSGNCYPHI